MQDSMVARGLVRADYRHPADGQSEQPDIKSGTVVSVAPGGKRAENFREADACRGHLEAPGESLVALSLAS